jgi:SIR2-like protein
MYLPHKLVDLLNGDRPPALFVGAGISFNAGIPIGIGVIRELKQQYPDKLIKDPDRYGYSQAFRIALPGRKHRAERRKLFEKLCADKPPAAEHHLISHLVNHGKFSIVFTTNFDHLTEIALSMRCDPQPQVYLYDEDIEPPENAGVVPKLVKLHGDFLFDDMANLEAELKQRLHENMRLKLLSYLSDRGLVVVGYGGNDKSIMMFLSELAESADGMKGGLWWVIYDEKDKHKGVRNLINKTLANEKPAEIVGPIEPSKFFETICDSVGLAPPEPIPFGIKPGDGTLVTSYTQRFGRARQLPPSVSSVKLDTYQEVTLGKLKTATESSGVVWLCGPPGSGKTTIIGRLAKELDSTRFFYFNHRFAHRPVSLNLILDLERFARGVGLPVVGREQFLEWLLDHNVVLAFDDLFSTSPKMEDEFLTELRRIIFIGQLVGKGTILLAAVRHEEMQDWINREPHGAIMSGQSNAIIDLCSTAVKPRAECSSHFKDKHARMLLEKMSLLRFAELPEVLTKLCRCRGIQSRLDKFERHQLVEKCGRRYILREDAPKSLQISEANAEKHRLELARRFEEISLDAPFFRRIHFGLEAERHYWQARRVREAFRQFFKVVDVLEGERRRLEQYLHHASSVAVLSSLNPEELIPLHRVTYEALQQDFIALEDFEFVDHIVERILSQRGEGYPDLVAAGWCRYHRKDLAGCKSSLLKAEKKFRASGNTQELANVQFDLSQLAFERMPQLVSRVVLPTEPVFLCKPLPHLDRRRLNSALFWAQKAERTYLRVRDPKAVSKARDHIANVLLGIGQAGRALKLEGKQRAVHAAEEGFTREKAVVYGNLFIANLELGHLNEAAGFFYQSNLNFAWVRDREGIFRNLSRLCTWLNPNNVHKLFSGYTVTERQKEQFIVSLVQCLRTLKQETYPPKSFTEVLQSGRW